MKNRVVLRTIQANRVTCGPCEFLRIVDNWWNCDLFRGQVNLGLVGAQKSPNRHKVCKDAEKAAIDAILR